MVVCGDSYMLIYGVFGVFVFGIGISEVEYVFVIQIFIMKCSKNMRILVDGELFFGVSFKDVVLYIIGKIGMVGGIGFVIEFVGFVICSLSMEVCMFICNMVIEGGVRVGMVVFDEIIFEYFKGCFLVFKCGFDEWNKVVVYWKFLQFDLDVKYDIDVYIDGKDIIFMVIWGISFEDVVFIIGSVFDFEIFFIEVKKVVGCCMLEYMGFVVGIFMEDIVVDKVFIGFCINFRIEDFCVVVLVVKGKKIVFNIKCVLIVFGFGFVKEQVEVEGFDKIFIDVGFEWCEVGCSMCLGMNFDILLFKERCVFISNCNFEGCQGVQGWIYFMFFVMVVVVVIVGKFVDVRKFVEYKGSFYIEVVVVFEIIFGKVYVDECIEMDDYEKEVFIDQFEDLFFQVNIFVFKVGSIGFFKFIVFKGIVVLMEKVNIDIDVIIFKQFLKIIKCIGFGKVFFYEWCYFDVNIENFDFVFNQELYCQVKIIVCIGFNFGCGFFCEYVFWVLNDFGVKSVIVFFFVDIFFNNLFKNGMFFIVIKNKDDFEKVYVEVVVGCEIEIDFFNQFIKDQDGNIICSFEVEEFRKYCLVNGFDDIGFIMQFEDKIFEFEKKMMFEIFWLDGRVYLKRKGQGGKLVVKVVLVFKMNRGEIKIELFEW